MLKANTGTEAGTEAGGRIVDIEILRGIAVLCVLVHHVDGRLLPPETTASWGFYEYFGGWVGVDLFFAISGFVIARVFVPQLSACATRPEFFRAALRFWVRRAFRLLPSAWLWLGITLVLQITWNDSQVFGTLAANLRATAAGVLQFANVRFAQTFWQQEYGTSFVYWSLSLEEQFYLVFPLLAWVVGRRLSWVLIVVVLLQVPFERNVWQMSFRTDALALGVLLALGTGTPAYRRFGSWFTAGSVWLPALLVAVGLVALVWFGTLSSRDLVCYVGMIALLAGLLVLVASFDANVISRALPGPVAAALFWLGTRSYAAYLIHIPAFYVVREAAWRAGISSGDHATAMVVAGFLLVLVLADANFRFVEMPMRERGRQIAARMWVGP